MDKKETENNFWEPCKRADGRMEWICPHGVGHGNHDHGCCGYECCSRDDFPGRIEQKHDDKEMEEESGCGKPCSPNASCNECAGYWQRMVDQGLWDMERHKWTDKGWASITRSI